jgi:hypothetical protein
MILFILIQNNEKTTCSCYIYFKFFVPVGFYTRTLRGENNLFYLRQRMFLININWILFFLITQNFD